MLPVLPRFARSALLFTTLLAAPSACVLNGEEHGHDDDGEEPIGTSSAALSASATVTTAVAQTCSTTSVKGLSTQLVQEIQCLRPGTLARIDGKPGITLGAAVFPWLQAPVANALVAARNARGTTLTINSGLRTLPQQYLLHRWYKTGRCGIPLAASPGTSNHESALAVDVQDNAGWRSFFTSRGMRWLGSGDPVHFDYVGSGAVSLKGLSVLAFQRLWNRNHPEDIIAADGDYGPATESRLAKSPAAGFPVGACATSTAGEPPADAELPPPADTGETAEVPVVPDATEPTEATEEAAAESTTASAALPVTDESEPKAGAVDTTADSGCAVSSPGSHDRSALASLVALAGVVAIARRRRRA